MDQSNISRSQLAIQSISCVSYASLYSSYRLWNNDRLVLSFQRSALAMGFSIIDDTSSPNALCDGISPLDSTVDQNKRRVSTLEAFLPRAIALQRESNLTICTGVIVSRIKFSGGHAEHRADEVNFQHAKLESEKVFSVRVKKEVILSSGAVGSPQVLMLRFGVLSTVLSDPVRVRRSIN